MHERAVKTRHKKILPGFWDKGAKPKKTRATSKHQSGANPKQKHTKQQKGEGQRGMGGGVGREQKRGEARAKRQQRTNKKHPSFR